MKKIIKYTDINLQTYEEMPDDLIFSRSNAKEFWKINSIAPYLAMFSPSLPKYFIERFTKKNDLVMDNFSGRGTTAVVSRQLNRRFIGNDLNPYAYVLSRFKISKIDSFEIQSFINKLKNQYIENKDYYLDLVNNPEYEEVNNYYSKQTLSQLIFLRETIGKNWLNCSITENTILAISCGLMHGPTKKDNSTIYFSLDMPNTISFTPNYVKKYTKKHKLIKPEVDIFNQIINRLNSIYTNELNNEYDGEIMLFNSTESNQNIKDESVDLVVTSPPYLNIVNYTNSNWLKLWLLGFERKKLSNDIKLSDKLTKKNYAEFIKKYLLAIEPKIKSGGKVCLVVGDVHGKKLIEETWNKIASFTNFNFFEIYYDNKYTKSRKVTNVISNRNIKATKIEKVLVLEKS